MTASLDATGRQEVICGTIRLVHRPPNYKCSMAINVQKSCSKEMDAILEEAKSVATQDARKVAYKTMDDLSLQEMDIVPLVNAWLLIAYANNLKGFTPLRTGFLKTLKDSWFES
jgi:peptide/nickel transport system substrate-binding protein